MRRFWVVAVVVGCALAGLMLQLMLGGSGRRAPMGAPRLGVIELYGVLGEDIDGSREAEQLRAFAIDPDIRAIVVRVDSPGGEVAPSQELHEEIVRARALKPVVCSMGGMAASGGYWVSVACDRIVANGGTLTGSIGVISQFLAAPELVKAGKVEQTTLKTGALKDAGSPFRSFGDADRVYFESLQADLYGQFLKVVSEGRHMSVDQVRPLADGRVLTGQEALSVGLVDKLGNFRTAVDEAMAMAGVDSEPELIHPPEETPPLLQRLLGADARATARKVVSGAVEGLASRTGLRGGVLVLAPGLAR